MKENVFLLVVFSLVKVLTNLSNTVAPLAWVPWVPRNPSIFEQWVPEPIIFERWKP